MRFFCFFIAVFLSACSTTKKYEEQLNTWVGKSESELVSHFGVPNNSYSLNDGSKLIMFHKDSGSSAIPIGGTYIMENYWCKTTFTIDKAGIVKSWKHEGNRCDAY